MAISAEKADNLAGTNGSATLRVLEDPTRSEPCEEGDWSVPTENDNLK